MSMKKKILSSSCFRSYPFCSGNIDKHQQILALLLMQASNVNPMAKGRWNQESSSLYKQQTSLRYRGLKMKRSSRSMSSKSGRSVSWYEDCMPDDLEPQQNTDDLNAMNATLFVRRGSEAPSSSRRGKGMHKSQSMKWSRRGYVIQNNRHKSSKMSRGKSMMSSMSSMSSRSKGKGGKGGKKGMRYYCSEYHPSQPSTLSSYIPTLQPTNPPTKRMMNTPRPTFTLRPRPTTPPPTTLQKDFNCQVDSTGIVGKGEGDYWIVNFYYQVETIPSVNSAQMDGELLQVVENELLDSMIPDVFPEFCTSAATARARTIAQLQRQRQRQRQKQARIRQRQQQQRRQLQSGEITILGLSRRPPDFVLNGFECAGSYNDPCYVINAAMSIYTQGLTETEAADFLKEAVLKTIRSGRVQERIADVERITMLNDDLNQITFGPTPAPSILGPTPQPVTTVPVPTIPTGTPMVVTQVPDSNPSPSPIPIDPPTTGPPDKIGDPSGVIIPTWGWVLIALSAFILCLCCAFVSRQGYTQLATNEDGDDEHALPDQGGAEEDETSNPYVGPQNGRDDDQYIPPPTLQPEATDDGFDDDAGDPNNEIGSNSYRSGGASYQSGPGKSKASGDGSSGPKSGHMTSVQEDDGEAGFGGTMVGANIDDDYYNNNQEENVEDYYNNGQKDYDQNFTIEHEDTPFMGDGEDGEEEGEDFQEEEYGEEEYGEEEYGEEEYGEEEYGGEEYGEGEDEYGEEEYGEEEYDNDDYGHDEEEDYTDYEEGEEGGHEGEYDEDYGEDYEEGEEDDEEEWLDEMQAQGQAGQMQTWQSGYRY